MSGFSTLVFMSVLLGASSFGMGMLPLSFVFSRATMSRLTSFGSGLLLGAGLGIIIPEGVEAVIHSGSDTGHVPTSTIALSLLAGFSFMLLTEQIFSPHEHPQPPLSASSRRADQSKLQFDAELGELELENGIGSSHSRSVSEQLDSPTLQLVHKRAYPLTIGLVLHALADGLALGSSVLSDTGSKELSLIVFAALIIHKAPTAFALTTSLLANSLSRAECRNHVAVFSTATPAGALLSYFALSSLGTGDGSDWTGIAMLVSGGSFLYVATVLQPVSPQTGNQHNEDDITQKTRIFFIVLGMFVPLGISSIIGHGH